MRASFPIVSPRKGFDDDPTFPAPDGVQTARRSVIDGPVVLGSPLTCVGARLVCHGTLLGSLEDPEALAEPADVGPVPEHAMVKIACFQQPRARVPSRVPISRRCAASSLDPRACPHQPDAR
jgi:hypothetical protein